MNPTQVFETSWWEYVLDAAGELTYGPFHENISAPVMRNIATGELCMNGILPTGALWAAHRRPGSGPDDYPPVGYDGLAIYCRHVDGHAWLIEGRASNCTQPTDRAHRCWVRHGTVGEKLTVDKNGLTCQAGAGSFFMGPNNEWHGFLRDGKLTP